MSSMNNIRIGIVGAAGYTGGELTRILVRHPMAEIVFLHSRSHTGKYVYEVHTDLLGDTDMVFTDVLSHDIDVLFLCMGHGTSRAFMDEHVLSPHLRVIDLSHDFRLQPVTGDKVFVYGLSEWNGTRISRAQYIANPGCFATAIQLGLLPLAAKDLLSDDVHISAVTGSTGAGQSLSASTHFSWRHANLSVYKAFGHQHLAEIEQSICHWQPSFAQKIHFIPHRGDFTRGILASMYTTCDLDLERVYTLYQEYYADRPFVQISRHMVDLKQVVNTNKCFLYIEKHQGRLLIVSVIDNLLKGASGQAVQNMNIMMGVEETLGLKLKATAF